jgi:hypothetical protein
MPRGVFDGWPSRSPLGSYNTTGLDTLGTYRRRWPTCLWCIAPELLYLGTRLGVRLSLSGVYGLCLQEHLLLLAGNTLSLSYGQTMGV